LGELTIPVYQRNYDWTNNECKELLNDIISVETKDRGTQELSENKISRIKLELQDVNLFNESDWENMNSFFILHLPKFENAFQPFIKHLK
jgi:uncharacterized protein with ParB-like and HNH nuclease domain